MSPVNGYVSEEEALISLNCADPASCLKMTLVVSLTAIINFAGHDRPL